MKFLFVTTVSGTVNAFLIPHIKKLVDNGHTVDLAFKTNKPIDEDVFNLGCNIYELNFNRSILKNNYIKLVKSLRDIIIQNNYDIVHTHTPIASMITRIACKPIPSVKIFYTAHGFHFYKGASLLNWIVFYPIEKILSRFTDVLITINKEDTEIAKNFNAARNIYIPGVGIDLDFYDTSIDYKKVNYIKEELDITKNNFVLISVGELNNNKNQQVVLKALQKLKDPNIIYIICGEGPNKEKLIKLVKEYEILNQVKFLGYRSDIKELLQISDIFVFPSFREGLSKSLMEAMTVHKPVIASKIRGNIDLIDEEKGGFLFNPKDSDTLSLYLKKLIDDPTLIKKFGAYNGEKIKDFSLSIVLKIMYDAYIDEMRMINEERLRD